MISKNMMGIIVAALIVATPVAVFSDDIQGALNSTIAPANDTNTSDSSNATTSTSQNNNESATVTDDTTTDGKSVTENTTKSSAKTVASEEDQGPGAKKVTYSDGSVMYVYTMTDKEKAVQEHYNTTKYKKKF